MHYPMGRSVSIQSITALVLVWIFVYHASNYIFGLDPNHSVLQCISQKLRDAPWDMLNVHVFFFYPTHQEKKNNMNWTWPWITFTVVAIAAVGVGIYFLVMHFTHKPTKQTTGDPVVETGKLQLDFLNTSNQALSNRYQTSGANLLSLQYHLLNINLYEDIVVTGTAWSPSLDATKQATFAIYSNGENLTQEQYAAYSFAEANADTEHYVDMTDAEEVATKLSFTAEIDPSLNGKEFHYLVVNWMRPIKFKAEFTDASGSETKLYSKTASNFVHFNTSETVSYEHDYSVMDTLMTEPGAEQTTVVLNNGGYFVRLAAPIVLDSTKSYRCLFAFNPEGLLKAATVPNTSLSVDNHFAAFGSMPGVAGDASGNHVYLPMLPLAPIVYESTDSIFKEVYILHYVATEDVDVSGPPPSPPINVAIANFDIVLEIYYRSSAPDDVAAATAITRLTADSDMIEGGVQASLPNIFFYEKEGPLMHFRPYDQNYKLIHGFTRKQSGTCSLFMFQGLGGHHVDIADQVEATISYDYQEPDVKII
jgi:hypothetical protein